MGAYIVTYDLARPGRDYDELHARIKAFDGWARIAESSWAVATNQSAVQVRDYLTPAIDANDKLFVSRLGSSAWIGLSSEVSEWLKNNI